MAIVHSKIFQLAILSFVVTIPTSRRKQRIIIIINIGIRERCKAQKRQTATAAADRARLMKFDNPVGLSLLSIAQIDSTIFDGQRNSHLEG